MDSMRYLRKSNSNNRCIVFYKLKNHTNESIISMNLNFGKFSLQLKRASASEDVARGAAEQVAASAGGLLPWPPGGIPMVYPSGNFGRENVTENLRHIRETVAACMHARSEAIGRGKFHARVGRAGSIAHDGSTDLRDALPFDHPLEKLLRRPNPIFDMSDLMELSSQWLDATGNSIWLKVRDGNGNVVELWPASVLSFQIERGADGLPETYRFLPSNAVISANDVIHIRRPDIRMSPFFGHGLISRHHGYGKGRNRRAAVSISIFRERRHAARRTSMAAGRAHDAGGNGSSAFVVGI